MEYAAFEERVELRLVGIVGSGKDLCQASLDMVGRRERRH